MSQQELSEELFNTEDLNQPQELIIAPENDHEESENIENTEEQNNLEENDEINGDEMEGIEENETEATENTEETSSGADKIIKKPTQDRITNLPISKIKHIIKLDPDVNLVNSEAVLVITKATEMFIKQLSKEAFGFATQNKKKTLAKDHVHNALQMLPIEL